jgi:hypothetical protein
MPSAAADRSKNARRAQLHRSAKYDGRAVTERARAAFRASFDPPALPGESAADRRARLRQGEASYRAYMSDLSAKGVEARKKAAAKRNARLASGTDLGAARAEHVCSSAAGSPRPRAACQAGAAGPSTASTSTTATAATTATAGSSPARRAGPSTASSSARPPGPARPPAASTGNTSTTARPRTGRRSEHRQRVEHRQHLDHGHRSEHRQHLDHGHRSDHGHRGDHGQRGQLVSPAGRSRAAPRPRPGRGRAAAASTADTSTTATASTTGPARRPARPG